VESGVVCWAKADEVLRKKRISRYVGENRRYFFIQRAFCFQGVTTSLAT
jgi:hypothetical protein